MSKLYDSYGCCTTSTRYSGMSGQALHSFCVGKDAKLEVKAIFVLQLVIRHDDID